MATEGAIEWTLFEKIATPADVLSSLVPGEEAVASFKTVRDSATITNKRLIVRDVQGIFGKKVEVYSVPWKSVDRFSYESAGMVDLDTEVELWTRTGHYKLKVGKNIDTEWINKTLSEFMLA